MQKKPKKGILYGLRHAITFPLFVATMAVPGIAILSSSYVAYVYGPRICQAVDQFVSYKRPGKPEVKPTEVIRELTEDNGVKTCRPMGAATDLI